MEVWVISVVVSDYRYRLRASDKAAPGQREALTPPSGWASATP